MKTIMRTPTITSVQSGSPAEGKILKGDVIIGAQGKLLGDHKAPQELKIHFPNPQMGSAIEDAQAKNGKLQLMIKRGGKDKTVTIQLRPLGSFGADFPQQDLKAEWLTKLNCKILAAKQLPDGSFPNGFRILALQVTPAPSLSERKKTGTSLHKHVHDIEAKAFACLAPKFCRLTPQCATRTASTEWYEVHDLKQLKARFLECMPHGSHTFYMGM